MENTTPLAVRNAEHLGLSAFTYDVTDVLPDAEPWVQVNDGSDVLYQGPQDRCLAYLNGYGRAIDAELAPLVEALGWADKNLAMAEAAARDRRVLGRVSSIPSARERIRTALSRVKDGGGE